MQQQNLLALSFHLQLTFRTSYDTSNLLDIAWKDNIWIITILHIKPCSAAKFLQKDFGHIVFLFPYFYQLKKDARQSSFFHSNVRTLDTFPSVAMMPESCKLCKFQGKGISTAFASKQSLNFVYHLSISHLGKVLPGDSINFRVLFAIAYKNLDISWSRLILYCLALFTGVLFSLAKYFNSL